MQGYQQRLGNWGRVLGLGVSIAGAGVQSAGAQSADFALDRPNPSAAGDEFSAVGEPATSESSKRTAVQLTSNYAHNLVQVRSSKDAEPITLVEAQWLVHLQTRVPLPMIPQASLLLDVPMAIVNEGASVRERESSFTSPGGPGLGTTRVGLRFALNADGAVRTAAELEWGAPTAMRGSYLGSDAGHYALRIHSDWERGPLRSVLSVWGRRDFPNEPILGAEMGGRLGLGVTSSYWSAAMEGLVWVSPQSLVSRSSTHAEIWASASYRTRAWLVRLSGGPGFALGPGTPAFRGLVSLGYHWETQVPSTALGKTRVLVEHVSPSGRAQRLDWTPLEREAAELPRRWLDEASSSPVAVADRAGEREPARAAEPCVTGTEGCLDVSMRVGQPVELLNPVLFGTGRDALPLDVEASLGAVVVVLNAHPELVRVAIEGHTDSVGDERDNLALSRRRAVAVMRWLVEHGVDERRLQVRAFGPRYPRFGNEVEEDRARNRRVEFTVVERDSRGRAAWHNGPARTSDASRGNP